MIKWTYNSARNAGNSLASWIVSKPLIALLLILILILASAGISATVVRNRTLLEAEKLIKQEKKALEQREKQYKLEFDHKLQPIIRERNRLKRNLVALQGERKSIKAPESEDELVARFRALGY
jgi:Na+-transporting methylmalonyl-CoA/oxaloacetate decarboxylase gamma subunit